MKVSLPKEFDTFTEAQRNGFLKVKKYKDMGINIVGYYCTYTPKEVILAAKAIPVALCATSDATIPQAEKHLPKNLCPLIKSSYGFAITDKCPYFYFSDMVVAETTCDGKKKMYELMREIKSMHILNLPNLMNSQDAFQLWKQEIVRMKEKIEQSLSVKITNQDLVEAIHEGNQERKVIKEFYEMMKMDPVPMTGLELFKVLYGSAYTFEKDIQNREILELKDKIMHDYEDVNKRKNKKARILITGCPMGGVTEKLIEVIENNDAYVVCFENCTGIREKKDLIDENLDPIEAIAKKYIQIPCACMMDNNSRFDMLGNLIDEYKVDGVIEMILQSCHPFSIESYKVKNYINQEKKKPYLSVEADYTNPDSEQNKTRIAAFIEMLN